MRGHSPSKTGVNALSLGEVNGASGQRAAGFIDVYEGAVRLEVTLPWLLAKFAHAAQRVIGQKGQLMLEKPPSS